MSGSDFAQIGEVTGEQRLKIIGLNGEKIVDESIFELKKAGKSLSAFDNQQDIQV